MIRFLRSVRRRLVIVRALERGGACAAVAAVFAFALAAIQLWRGENALISAAGILATGAAIGIAWGLAVRPRLLDAALTADEQLNLADLLVTALASSAQRDDEPADEPWSHAVLAMAEQRCRSLSPDAVVIRKFGGRAWGGIGLAGALVLTVASLSAIPQDSRGRQRDPAAVDPLANVGREAAQREALPNDDSASVTASKPPTVPPPQWEPQEPSALAPEAPQGNGAGSSRMSPTSAAGAGTASGQTPMRSGEVPRVEAGGQDSRVGDVAAGGRSESANGTGPANSSGDSGSSAAPSVVSGVTPPWQTSSWPAAREEALEAVRKGRVPDVYRDVVEGYFQDR